MLIMSGAACAEVVRHVVPNSLTQVERWCTKSHTSIAWIAKVGHAPPQHAKGLKATICQGGAFSGGSWWMLRPHFLIKSDKVRSPCVV